MTAREEREPVSTEHSIIIDSELEEDTGAWETLLSRVIPAALEAEGVTVPCEVDVLLTDDEGIHQINLEQREVDRPTDVLSFPMFEFAPGEPPTDDADADPETVPALPPLGRSPEPPEEPPSEEVSPPGWGREADSSR